MADYAGLLKEKFPIDERLGLYKQPSLPAKKLGKVLASETRIASPNDVVGLHIHEGFFSTAYVIFTPTQCYYPKGAFLLDDVREVQVKEDTLTIMVNQKGSFSPHTFTVMNQEVSELLRKLFQNIQSFDTNKTETPPNDYSSFEGKAIDWLLLRDEVMKTIDMLYDKFNEGKLSLLEYEEKKASLLARL
jgi:hypothetical protein